MKQAKEFKESFMERINQFGNFQDGRYTQNQWDIYLIGLEAGKSGCCSIMGAIVAHFVNEVSVYNLRDFNEFVLRTFIEIFLG